MGKGTTGRGKKERKVPDRGILTCQSVKGNDLHQSVSLVPFCVHRYWMKHKY